MRLPSSSILASMERWLRSRPPAFASRRLSQPYRDESNFGIIPAVIQSRRLGSNMSSGVEPSMVAMRSRVRAWLTPLPNRSMLNHCTRAGESTTLRLHTSVVTHGHGFFGISLAAPVLRSGIWLHLLFCFLVAAKVMLHHAMALGPGSGWRTRPDLGRRLGREMYAHRIAIDACMQIVNGGLVVSWGRQSREREPWQWVVRRMHM